MKFLKILFEKYDLSEPQNLKDDEILVLWSLTSGVQVFKVEETLEALEFNSETYKKLSNFLLEGKKRNLFDDSEVTKFQKSLFSLKKIKEKTRFQCQFCSMVYAKNDTLKWSIHY